MAASVTATSVLPVPPKPEPSVITPDFSDGSRIAAIVWRRHSADSSCLARSRLPGATTSPCLTARREKAPRIPFSAGAMALEDRGEGVAQVAASLPGKPFHHSPSSSGYRDIAFPHPGAGLGQLNYPDQYRSVSRPIRGTRDPRQRLWVRRGLCLRRGLCARRGGAATAAEHLREMHP